MSTISANTFLAADGTTTTEPSIPALDQRMAKAWCTVNQIGTQTLLLSYKVSSITDTQAGNTVVNFTETQPNANYCINVSGHKQSYWDESVQHTLNSTTSVQLQNARASGAYVDTINISCSIFGE
jgi:hypothetical protein